jgi:hypothetical protein
MQNFVKKYNQFINEGAQLSGPNFDIVKLNWLDDKKAPLEVLKSNNSHDVTGFRKIGVTKDGSFQVYYGLTIDQDRTKELGDSDPVFKLTLDALKQAKIDGSARALAEFIKPTAREIRAKKGTVDYVVSLGSTAGLSQDLGERFSQEFKDAQYLQLPKENFENFEKALNWDYIKNYETKVKEEGVRPIFAGVKQDILDAIDRDKTSPEIIAEINAAKTADEVQAIITRSNPANKYREYSEDDSNVIFWKVEPFNIRSSGISRGGSRQWLKTKYSTPKPSGEFGDPIFVEAVKKCILGTSTMLFVDDNSRTKEDISRIFDSIIMIADNILADSETVTPKMAQYHKRFLAYVLIYLPEPGQSGDSNNIGVKKLATETTVNQFREGGLPAFAEWINSHTIR